jgi:hypothetical protein
MSIRTLLLAPRIRCSRNLLSLRYHLRGFVCHHRVETASQTDFIRQEFSWCISSVRLSRMKRYQVCRQQSHGYLSPTNCCVLRHLTEHSHVMPNRNLLIIFTASCGDSKCSYCHATLRELQFHRFPDVANYRYRIHLDTSFIGCITGSLLLESLLSHKCNGGSDTRT